MSALSESLEKLEKHQVGTNQHQLLRSLCFLAVYPNFSLNAVIHNDCLSRVDVEQYLIGAPKLNEFAKPFLSYNFVKFLERELQGSAIKLKVR